MNVEEAIVFGCQHIVSSYSLAMLSRCRFLVRPGRGGVFSLPMREPEETVMAS